MEKRVYENKNGRRRERTEKSGEGIKNRRAIYSKKGGKSERLLTCRFRPSLKHKDDGQTKFIKPNSQRQDIIIKYWVRIGSIHREQG